MGIRMDGSSAQPHFRVATSNDIDVLLLLGEAFYREAGLDFEAVRIRTGLLELLRDSSLGGVWLLEVAGAAIGYLVLVNGFIVEFGGRHLFIDELYINPTSRGQGVGRATLAFAENVCRQAAINLIRLEVDCRKPRLIRFYEELGFTLHDRFTMTRILG